MDSSNNLDGKSRFGQVRELFNEDKTVGERITLDMLAKKYNTSASTLSRIEKGAQQPGVNELKAYSETFGVTLGYLLGIDESENMKETAIIRSLGLTDSAAQTLKEIMASSSQENDLSAVLNALLGNGKLTVKFFDDLLHYLQNENGDVFSIDRDILGGVLFSSMRDYIDKVVKIQLRKVLPKTQQLECLSVPDTTGVTYSKIPDSWKQARPPEGTRRRRKR